MDVTLETPPTASAVATEAPQTGEAAGKGQPKSGKPSLAEVLAKVDRKEKLTAQERGVLGGAKRKANAKAHAPAASENFLLEPEAPASQPPPPVAGTASNPLLEPEAQAQIEVGGMVLSAADSASIQAAAEAILDGMDTTTKIYIGYEARLAGADDATVKAYESAVALKSSNRDLMAKNSEPVVLALCKFLHCSPDKLASILKNSQFFSGLFCHAMTIWATVKSIRESAKEKPA